MKIDELSGGSPCNLPWDRFFLPYTWLWMAQVIFE